MPKLPVLSGKKLLSILLRNGFVAFHRKGSHVFIEDPTGKRGTAIPLHGNEDLGRGLLKSIMSDLDLEVSDLLSMLRK